MLPMKNRYQIWYRAARVISQSATKCTYLQFMVLEGKDCNENLHEGGYGHCRRNNINIIHNKMILTL